MTAIEKIAFLKGLVEGSDLNLGKKEKKIVDEALSTLSTMEEEMSEMKERIDYLTDMLQQLMETIEDATEDLSMFYDEDYDDPIEIDCPNCGDSVIIDDEDCDDGVVLCGNCGHKIDLDSFFEDFEDDDDTDDADDDPGEIGDPSEQQPGDDDDDDPNDPDPGDQLVPVVRSLTIPLWDIDDDVEVVQIRVMRHQEGAPVEMVANANVAVDSFPLPMRIEGNGEVAYRVYSVVDGYAHYIRTFIVNFDE